MSRKFNSELVKRVAKVINESGCTICVNDIYEDCEELTIEAYGNCHEHDSLVRIIENNFQFMDYTAETDEDEDGNCSVRYTYMFLG